MDLEVKMTSKVIFDHSIGFSIQVLVRNDTSYVILGYTDQKL